VIRARQTLAPSWALAETGLGSEAATYIPQFAQQFLKSAFSIDGKPAHVVSTFVTVRTDIPYDRMTALLG
jgi:hypothetical protein